MQQSKEVAYRLALSDGFINEAKQDIELGRWRSCVDNAQLAVENAGKAILGLFGVPSKTHDPAQQLATLLSLQSLPLEIQETMQQLLPGLLALGAAEHFLTDYGDERTYTLPWDLFTVESATEALNTAQQVFQLADTAVQAIAAWQQSSQDKTS